MTQACQSLCLKYTQEKRKHNSDILFFVINLIDNIIILCLLFNRFFSSEWVRLLFH